MTDTKDMRRSCLTIGDINWAQAHIDAQDAKIKALVEALEHCKECAGDTVTMPTSVIHAIYDAAIAAAKETA